MALYEVKQQQFLTLPNLEKTDQVLSCQSFGSDVLIAVDRTLILIENDSLKDFRSLDFDAEIDAIVWSNDARFIIVGDRNGCIYVLGKTSFKILFTQAIPGLNTAQLNDTSCFLSILCNQSKLKGYCIFVALTSGKIIIFDNLDLDLLLTDENGLAMKKIKGKLVSHLINTTSYHRNLLSIINVASQFDSEFLSLGVGECLLALWKCDEYDALFGESPSFEASLTVNQEMVKMVFPNFEGDHFVKISQCFSYIFALDNKGSLLLLDSSTLILLQCWHGLNMKDFVVKMSAKPCKNNGMSLGKLYGLDRNSNDIKVYDFSDMKQIFNVPCSYGTQTICHVPLKWGCLYTVEGPVCKIGQKNEVIVKSIIESSPKSRLLSLLDRELFTEALALANEFNLDKEQIFQRETSSVVNNLVLEDDIDLLNKKFLELQECVNKVQNAFFVGELLCNNFHPDLSMTFKLLSIARDHLNSGGRLFRASVSEEESSELQLRGEIDSLLDSILTFQMIFPSGDTESWIKFKSNSLSVEFVCFLTYGDFRAANLILKRHSIELIDNLQDSDMLKALINQIPEEIDVNNLVCFLETFLRTISMSNVKGLMEVIAQWLISRIEQLGRMEVENWPHCGLKIAETFFKIQQEATRLQLGENFSSNLSALINGEEITKLRRLVADLKALANLKNRYDCVLTLQDFSKETTLSLTFRILDKVNVPELIPSFMDRTVRPYIKEHGLNEDEILLEYIKELLSFNIQDRVVMQSICERKIIAIVQCITNKETTVKATIELSKNAYIPWLSDVEGLVKNAYDFTTALYDDITKTSTHFTQGDKKSNMYLEWKEELDRLISHNKLLAITNKYDYPFAWMRHISKRIRRFMYYLIKKNEDEALLDAIKVAKVVTKNPKLEVYSVKLIMMINLDWVTDPDELVSTCCEVLDKNPDIAHKIVDRMISAASCAEKAGFCLAALGMLKYLLQKHKVPSHKKGSYARKLERLKCTYELKKNFDLSIKNFHDVTEKKEILTKYTSQHCQSAVDISARVHSNDSSNSTLNLTNHSGSGDPPKHPTNDGDAPKHLRKTSIANVVTVGRLLQFAQENVEAQVAIQASKNCQASSAIEICKEIYDTSPSFKSAEAAHKVAFNLLNHLEDNPKQIVALLPQIHVLLCQAVSCCKPEQIIFILPLVTFCRLAKDLYLSTDEATKITLSKGVQQDDQVDFLGCCFQENDGLDLQINHVHQLLAKVKPMFFSEDGSPLCYQQPKILPKTSEVLIEIAATVSQITSCLADNFRFTRASQWISFATSNTVSYLNNHQSFFNGNTKTNSIICSLINQTIKKSKKQNSDFAEALAKKVLLSRNCDVKLAAALLGNLPVDQVFNFLHSVSTTVKNNFHKVEMIATVGLKLSGHFREMGKQKEFASILLDVRWASRLVSKKVPVEGFLHSSRKWKKNYILKMMESPNISGPVLCHFIRDYDYDRDFFLLHYVTILLGGEASFEEEISCSINSVALFSSELSTNFRTFSSSGKDEVEEDAKLERRVKNELKWVVQNVVNKYELLRHLELCFLNDVCPYNYDRCEFMFKLIQLCAATVSKEQIDVEKGFKVVDYLRRITRVHPPSTQYEIKQGWRKNDKEGMGKKLPKLSQTRLPVHVLLFGDLQIVWELLATQVNTYSIDHIIPLAQNVGIKIERIYFFAANNLIKQFKSSHDENNDQKFTKETLSRIQEILQKIEDLQVVMSMSKTLLDCMSPGEEKVDMCKWCLSIVMKWLASAEVDQRVAVDYLQSLEKILQHRLKIAQTELILIEHDLYSKQAMSLLRTPMKLVHHLYCHPSILKRFYEPNDSYTDIHAAFTSIALLYNKEPMKLNQEFIQSMLLADDKSNSIQEKDIMRNMDSVRSQEIVIESEGDLDFVRLLYLLQYGDFEIYIDILLNLISNNSDERITKACKIRAYNCVLYMADDKTLLEKIQQTREQAGATLRILIYRNELESANFPISLSQLQQKDKSSVARRIVASAAHRNNPVAVRAAAEMCREFGPVSADTWTAVLQQLVALKQVGHLRHLLPTISKTHNSLSCLASVWQSCIMLPLVEVVLPLDPKQKEIALSAFEFMVGCPVLLQVNLSAIAKQYCSLDLHILALGCLLLSPDQRKNAEKFAMRNIKLIKDGMEDLRAADDPRHAYINTLVENFLRVL